MRHRSGSSAIGLSLVIVATLVTGAGAAGAVPVDADDDPPPFELVTVAEGVHAAVKPAPLRFVDANVTIVVNEGGLVVVDAHGDPLAQRRLVDSIRGLTDRPVRWVIATHWHPDHVGGLGSYLESSEGPVEVIGHETLGADIESRAGPRYREETTALAEAVVAAEEKLAALDRDGSPDADSLRKRIERARSRLAARRDARIPAPTTTFTDRMTLHRGNRTIRLLHFRAHTRGDVVVHLPDDGVLITGDVVDDLPYGGDSYPRRWLRALRRIEELEFDVMVPGHGSIRNGKEHLRAVIRLMDTLIRRVDAAIAEGRDLETTVREVDLADLRPEFVGDDELAGRAFDEFIPATVRRAWLEGRGELE